MSDVVIGIASYNGAQRLRWLLHSLWLRTRLTARDVSIVLVDDGSPRRDETRHVFMEWQDKLPLYYHQHPTNRGISAGWNSATRAFASRLNVLLNDDVILPSTGVHGLDWLDCMTFALDENPGVGGVGINWHAFLPEDAPALLASPTSDLAVTPRDPNSKAPAPERRTYEEHGPGRVMCPSGQCFAFRWEDFDAIGGFDEGYQSFYEESDFGTAMASRGKIGMQLNFPQCWHLWSATFASSPELRAGARMEASRRRYIAKWAVPPEFQTHEAGRNVFDFTNPKYLGALPPVAVRYRKADGSVGEATL